MAKKLPKVLGKAGIPQGLAGLAKGEAGGLGGVAKLVTDGGGGGLMSSALGASQRGPPRRRRLSSRRVIRRTAPAAGGACPSSRGRRDTPIRRLQPVHTVRGVDEVHAADRVGLPGRRAPRDLAAKQWRSPALWQAEIVDQRPDERIAGKSTSGPNLAGVPPSPKGRARMEVRKRSIRGDLHRFKGLRRDAGGGDRRVAGLRRRR